MDKDGGSRRLISTLITGGDGDVYLDKSSKKEKLRRLSSMGLLSHSINTNKSTSNRVKIPKKFLHHCAAINHASAPRKLRSAIKTRDTKRHKAVAVSNRSEAQKPRLGFEKEFKDSKKSSVVMTKDEEEVAEALFALAQAGLKTTPQVEVKPPPPSLVEETMTPNARNRCSVHVYICSFIKLLQTKIDKGSNQARSDTNPQTITNNDYADVADTPKTTTETTTSQDHMGLHLTSPPTFDSLQKQVVPYFDTMNRHHHSQGSTQHLTSTRHDRTTPVSGSKYTQGSLLQVLRSGHATNIEQQRQRISMSSKKGKMQSSDRSSGYDEKGGLFFVDGLTLNLTL